jgi:hypothetical protein
MQPSDQSEYFCRRAEEERIAADKASDERAARTHRALAARYTAKARGGPVREVDHDGVDNGSILANDFTILPSSPAASHS